MRMLAAVELNFDGLKDFLKTDAVNVGFLLIGVIILFSAKARDWPAAMNRIGIAMIGIVVVGLAGNALGLGTSLSDLFVTKG